MHPKFNDTPLKFNQILELKEGTIVYLAVNEDLPIVKLTLLHDALYHLDIGNERVCSLSVKNPASQNVSLTLTENRYKQMPILFSEAALKIEPKRLYA